MTRPLPMKRPSVADMIRACKRAKVPRAKIIIGLAAYYGLSQHEMSSRLYHVNRTTRSRRADYRVGAP